METSKHNSPNIYAHSLPEQPRTDWQTLETHANAVAIVAAKFAADFQCENWAWNAGQLHDIGKADPTFQAYLLRCNGLDDSEYDVAGQGRVNHSSAGAAFALNDFPPVIGHALAYIIAGHHAGLPDWESSETGNASLKIRVVEGRGNVQKIPRAVESARATLRALVPPPYIKPATYHIWVRLLFSCLVDADYLDTEAFMQPGQISFRGGYAGMAKLKQLFDNHMLALTESAQQTDLNSIRKEILSACRSSALKESGLFSLTVPTGGGKTLSAMAFALPEVDARTQRLCF